MTVTVVLAHPYAGSFNHAIYETVTKTLTRAGCKIYSHDLCAEGFDPRMPESELPGGVSGDPLVERYKRELIESDGIVIVHPNWWGMPPAVLKGWIDRVFREGTAYRFAEGDSGGGVPEGLFAGKTAVVFNTSNTEERRENEVFGDPLERLWRDCVFGFCGVTNVCRKTFRVVADSTPEQRAKWLREVERAVAERFAGSEE